MQKGILQYQHELSGIKPNEKYHYDSTNAKTFVYYSTCFVVYPAFASVWSTAVTFLDHFFLISASWHKHRYFIATTFFLMLSSL